MFRIVLVRMLVVGGCLGGVATAEPLLTPATSHIKLRPNVVVEATPVLLSDVLDLTRAEPELAAIVAGQPASSVSGTSIEVSSSDVLAAFDALNINMTRVLLSGAAVCEVTVKAASPPLAPSPVSDSAAASLVVRGRTVDRARPASGPSSLADLIRLQLERELADLGGRLEVQFERASSDYVSLTNPPHAFSVRSRGGGGLGIREFDVAIKRDGRMQRETSIFASVRLIKPVLTARRALNVGQFIRPDDVVMEERVFESESELGLAEVGAAVGQQIERYVEAGAMVRASDLRPVDLVTRNRPVTVLGKTGGVVAQVTGVALDAGRFGDHIRVRLGANPRDRREVRGVVVGVASVRLLDPREG